MSGWITDIEEKLHEILRAAFTVDGKLRLKTVDSLPGEFTAESVAQMRIATPAVYSLFIGGRVAGRDTRQLQGSWALYAVTAHAGGQKERRHGDPREIGAYEILSILIPALNDVTIEDVGTMKLTEAENLFTGKLMGRGIAAYAATFTLPMPLPDLVDPATLADFNIYHSDWAEPVEGQTLPLPEDGGHPINHLDLSEEQ